LLNSRNERLKIHACDFSKKAVELIRANEAYDERYIQADVWDVASPSDSENGGLPPGLQENSVDVVLMIFIFSALSPDQWDTAVRNIWRVLKPGGQVLFRDYGRGDLAQVRFKKGRYLEENFYVRGDGTRVYFFEQEELQRIWCGEMTITNTDTNTDTASPPSQFQTQTETEAEADTSTSTPTSTSTSDAPRPTFEVAHIGVDRRMLVNRQRRLKMYRCWMQAVFRKAGQESEVPTSTLRQDKEDEGAGEGEGEGEEEGVGGEKEGGNSTITSGEA
jgi:tRNAThr (cytosine32-N3)-methyltransferase